MKIKLSLIISVFVAFMGSGCASIVSDANYPVSVRSKPSKANVVVKDEHGEEVREGTTPMDIELPAGDGYFDANKYSFHFRKKGHESDVAKLNTEWDKWYGANWVFGGPIGYFLLDPATGAMWKLEDDFVHGYLRKKNISSK